MELWTLGLCMVVRDLMRIYSSRKEPKLFGIYRQYMDTWLQDHENPAKDLIGQTVHILDIEHAEEQKRREQRRQQRAVLFNDTIDESGYKGHGSNTGRWYAEKGDVTGGGGVWSKKGSIIVMD